MNVNDLNNLGFNATFVLTFVGLVGTGLGVCIRYCLVSRCVNIKCCCIECRRVPLE
jgi:hypothetical protein